MSDAPGEGASLEERAVALARASSVTKPGGGRWLRRVLAKIERTLRDIELQLTGAESTGADLGRAGEWLLDNAYLVAETLHQVTDGLPGRFHRKLPNLAGPPTPGRARVYAIAREVIDEDDLLDLRRVQRFIERYQVVTPLTMAELWAFPMMLRLVLLEKLADLAAQIVISTSDTPAEPVTPVVAGRRIGICITGLRIISAHDWKRFFESLSLVERTLRSDPAQVYPRMDFQTRDRYRKAVERLAARARVSEQTVAAAAVAVGEDGVGSVLAAHVGYYLIGEGSEQLCRDLATRPGIAASGGRWVRRHATAIYLAGITTTTALVASAPVAYVVSHGASALQIALCLAAGLLPALSIAVSLVHWVITHIMRPQVLPKMDFEEGIPSDCRTIVVVPTLLTSWKEVRELLHKLEVSFHGNRDPNLAFALLTDFADASSQSMPDDESLVTQAVNGMQRLNEQHGGASRTPFFLFHRERRWNEREGRWMGWERKRGKLEEFNRLLLGSGETSYHVHVGSVEALAGTRYVITLDTDTGLPRGEAARLIATLAHPMNQAQFDDRGRVRCGYTVLQPRIEISPNSTAGSLFATLFHGDVGLDLYTRAVSDVYQDFFGEGIYAGKGIYDVAAFERSLAGRVPENALLSHDLFEGVHGRAALASDLAMFEEYPDHVLAFSRRMHRWVRGDWQIAPWLFPNPPGATGPIPNRLSLISRWKIFDNLRRSLVAPSVVAFLILGWLALPGSPWFWSAMAVGIVGIPTLLSAASVATRLATGAAWSATLKGAAWSFPTQVFRFLVAAIFLPFETAVVSDAIVRTVYRLRVSRRNLLQWTSAAHTARALSAKNTPGAFWREMARAPLLALAIGVLVWLLHPPALPAALPFVGLWFVSPQVGWLLSRSREEAVTPLPHADRRALRLLARRTWHYFERFIGPGDHWLAPDNFQEEPKAAVARRTSPTNLGLALIAPVAAYDFGYVGVTSLAATLRNIVESMAQLERYRGHYLNWYETVNRSALLPRYVSAVDSGNLAACLIALKSANASILRTPLVRPIERQGLLDTADVLAEVVRGAERRYDGRNLPVILDHLATLKSRVRDTAPGAAAWRAVLVDLRQDWLKTFNAHVADLLTGHDEALDHEVLKELRTWSDRVRHAIVSPLRELDLLLPWIPLLAEIPVAYLNDGGPRSEAWKALRGTFEKTPTLRGLVFTSTQARRELEVLEEQLSADGDESEAVEHARRWNARLREALDLARQNAQLLLSDLHAVNAFAEESIAGMDFGFLFDPLRRLFHIGYNVSAGEFDTSYYDLLASEARIASIVAIAKGEVPLDHWLYLRRPFGRVRRRRVLLSWSGTMFEFLMPNLFTSSPKDTVLQRSATAAVQHQIAYAQGFGVPWGISESGFYQLDAHANYQYRAFGVPGLGLRMELGDRLVIAPYASMLALSVSPNDVTANLQHLAKLKMLGQYGLFEAIDYGPTNGKPTEKGAIVRSYMTHHQGMILQALNNFLNANVMVRRFHNDPRIASAELLLYEHPPRHVPVERRWLPEKRAEQPVRAPVATQSWLVPVRGPVPQSHVLSNRRYSVLLTANGGGYSRWKDVALTRWRSDPCVDAWGSWIYVRDIDTGAVWSVGYEPTRQEPHAYEVQYAPHMAEYSRHDHGISIRMNVTVPPTDDVEIRRVTVVNDGNATRHLMLTSYGEVVLADDREDVRHQAFTKLFVQSEHTPQANVLVFERRRRSAGEEPVFLAHGVTAHHIANVEISGEMDREGFLGRGGSRRSPEIMHARGARMSVASGATLDPVFSLTCKFEIPPNGEAVLIFTTSVGRTRAEVLATQESYRSLTRVDWAFDQSQSYSEFELNELGIPAEELRQLQELFSALVYPYHGLRSTAHPLTGEMRSRSGLWAHGISGDHPILLVRVGPSDDLEMVRRLLVARTYWRWRHARIDLVVLDEGSVGYMQPLHDRLESAIASAGAALPNPGEGVFLVSARQLDAADRVLLERVARVRLDAAGGPIAEQLTRLYRRPDTLPGFVPVPSAPLSVEEIPPLQRPTDLQFDNGLGGFSADGREYVIHLRPGDHTPAPWINVIANPSFGFLVSESGGGNTWADNSGENRLTSWHNDPVADEPSEVLYLRDEETARIWSPTPRPAGVDEPYQIRHTAGATEFVHHSHGLEQHLLQYVAKDDPVKIVRLTLRNHWNRHRRLTATYFADWVLGTSRDVTAAHIITDYDGESQALLARNPFHDTYGERIAFLAASTKLHGITADRTEFLGEAADLVRPAGLHRIGLSGNAGAGLNPCAALQIHIELPPGQATTVHFLLGEGNDLDHVRALVGRYRSRQAADTALDDVRAFWDERLEGLTVETPDAAMNLVLNRWLLYQTMACRLWGRSALYQSSGAFGFRDQLQDVMAVMATSPELARAHILEAARHQFSEGDVLHWWHPLTEQGVRTRCSDDLVWLPFVTAHYVEVTGDRSILEEEPTFLSAPELGPDEHELFAVFRRSDEARSLHEHCLRALERAITEGPRGLPLIGSCDWNDGFSRVGIEGRGESIWLGWFLYATLNAFAPLCEARGEDAQAARFRDRAEGIRQAIEDSGWDGQWYRRAYYDDGRPLGSAESDEAQIDSIAQSWSVLSGGGEEERSRRAIRSALDRLVRRDDRLVLLLTPPFNKTTLDPGYIKGYPPGVRENGGQYTHAAAWLAWAVAQLGDGDQAHELFQLLNPIHHAATIAEATRYRVEPYVVAADVYGEQPHVGRGGWTWYTGSASWVYRLGVEAILGIRKRGDALHIEPCIPLEWPGFRVVVRHGTAVYRISIENRGGVERGVAELLLDGDPVAADAIPLVDDGESHEVVVRLGVGGGGLPDEVGSGAASARP